MSFPMKKLKNFSISLDEIDSHNVSKTSFSIDPIEPLDPIKPLGHGSTSLTRFPSNPTFGNPTSSRFNPYNSREEIVSPVQNLEKFRIPLKNIKSALNQENFIADGEYSKLYKGQLSKNRTVACKRFDGGFFGNEKENFLNELAVVSDLKHKNIVPFHGYCEEGGEMIIVYKFPVNGSLADYLETDDPVKRSCLTWQHRLEICLDAARGLNYLHSGHGQHGTRIHGAFMDKNILLDDNLKAKICGFEISEFIPGNQPRQQVYKPHTTDANIPTFTHKDDSDSDGSDSDNSHTADIDMYSHKDPIYLETGFLKAESDIYSFGVLLFRVLTSPEAFKRVSKKGGGMPKSLTMMVQHYYDNRLDSLIDPAIKDQIGSPSFHRIEEIACKCLSYNIKDRPTMDAIVKTIEDALKIHNGGAFSVKGSCGEDRNPREHIPFKEIELAMQRSKKWFRPFDDGYYYPTELSERWPNRKVAFKVYKLWPDNRKRKMFYNELDIVSRFYHKNIIPFIGYCDEKDEKVLIYEHAINGSLRDHLQHQDKLRCILWEQRLKICLGAARGLRCLHSGLWDENRLVVHRHVRSKYILLDENMEAKISGLGLSIFVPRNKPQFADNNDKIKKSNATMDPIYKQSGIVNTEVDVYSFGLVMFEILSGSVLPGNFNDRGIPDLIRRVHRHYGANEMDKLIDPNIRDQIDGRSLQTFAETAYRCLSFDIKERPSMNRIIKKIEEALYFQKHRATDSTTTIRSLQFQKPEVLPIPLKEIKLATRDFCKTSEIGKGAYGVVYKGRLSKSWTKNEAAFKRLQKITGKEKTEFVKELELISKFHHQNIIRLIGYCFDGGEMIFVSEYAVNGSLDDHLENKEKMRLLTWNKRLKICLGAAKGLAYLHSGLGEDNKVIHRDVKSGNILLDDNLEAKICDFGLSKSGLTYDHQHSKHYTDIAGTDRYMDPVYHESSILRAESDVYSFGVVMFEMLRGMPAYHLLKIGDDKPRPLLNQVRRYYDSGKKMLIDPQINEIDNGSFHTFIEAAYQCISFNSKERPSMEMIADKIEEALDFQEKKEGLKQR